MMTTDKTFSKRNTCSVCNSPDLIPVIEILNVPIFCNQLFVEYGDAIKIPRGTINLSFCQECGHVFNTAFNAELMNYNQKYENSLHFSARFQDYAESLARELIKKYDLNAKNIVEIGCGKGDFLDMLCQYGDNVGFGFDPSFEVERFEERDDSRFQVIQDLYSEKYANYKADLLCCRHVLEHIEDPRKFLLSIRETIGKNLDTTVFFEVPNVMFTLKDLGIWDLIYEHCGYFSKASIAQLFRSCGFDILALSDAFGGQFECIEAKPRDLEQSEGENDFSKTIAEMHQYVTTFSDTFSRKTNEWRNRINEMVSENKKIVVWGAGSKGVTFLNILEMSGQIPYIVDINPHKQGMYVPGTGQKIVSPEFLQEFKPDVIVVMNPVYVDEITENTKLLQIPCSVVAV